MQNRLKKRAKQLRWMTKEPNQFSWFAIPQSSDRSLRLGVDSYIVIAMAVIVVICATLWAFFSRAYIKVDDIMLYNPIYMYVHTGRMTSPSYPFYHSMVMHPPTHYFILAWFIKGGLPLQYVGLAPVFLLNLLTAILITRSRFSDEIKIPLLFGLFAGAVFFLWSLDLDKLGWSTDLKLRWTFGTSAFGLRPDLHLAFAWMAGLVALETGRLQSWHLPRLALGAFLLTYASGIHYPASFAWTGVLVYMAWLIWERGWSEARRPFLALVLGACSFGIPYLLFFVIPHWGEIISFVKTMDASGGIHASLAAHIQLYRTLYRFFPQQFPKILYAPLAIGIPVVVISSSIFLVIKQTRGIGLASLPYLLFLLLFVERKFSFYLYPELMLYLCAVSILFALICRRILDKFALRFRWLFVPFLGVFFSGVLILGLVQEGAGEITLRAKPNIMMIARAAGRKILGPNALVGERLGRFYVSGGDLSYMIEPDLLWHSMGDRELKEYFRKFDALAEDPFHSDDTVNDRKESLASWYAEGSLNLRGFFFSDAGGVGSEYLLLNARRPAQLEGYGLRPDGRVAYFSERIDAPWIFVAANCNQGGLDKLEVHPPFRSSYLLPLRESVPKQLEVFAIQNEQYQLVRSKIAGYCAMREETHMAIELINADKLLNTLNNDHLIRFFEAPDDALEVRDGPEFQVEVTADGSPKTLRFLRGASQGKSYSLTEPAANILLRSELDDTRAWEVNRYGRSGNLGVQTDNSGRTDHIAKYSSGDIRDHLASPFQDISPKGAGSIFFSIWVKPLDDGQLPSMFLQRRDHSILARARPLIFREDGWLLLGALSKEPSGHSIRMVIIQAPNTASMLRKSYIAEVPEETPH